MERAVSGRGVTGQEICFSRAYTSLAARSAERDADFQAEFHSLNNKIHRSNMTFVDRNEICIISVRDGGGIEMRGAVPANAIVAVFMWGRGALLNGVRQEYPRLVLLGPGTELTTTQPDEYRYFRVGLRGAAFDRLREHARQAWLQAGIRRPQLPASAEWHLQRKILRTAAFAETAARRGLAPDAALAACAIESAAELASLVAHADDQDERQSCSNAARRRLVARALAILQASPDEPVAVASVCQALDVSERSLQRAFSECLGVGLRAYERERRLRGVHGMILAHGGRRSITEIAMSFGFWHLGRFSRAYASLFGCVPSETRRRVWGDGQELAP